MVGVRVPRARGDKGPVIACPEINTKRSCILVSITCIALTLQHLAAKMLEYSLQFLVGSAGTLPFRYPPISAEG